MAKDVFSHAFAQSATNRDRAVATFGKAYKKAASKDTDPYGLLRAALRWGSAQAAAAQPVQKPMDAALAGFYRPVEGAFSVFRRFRAYWALWRFSRLGCASTLLRCKGRVATRLRRRERDLIRWC